MNDPEGDATIKAISLRQPWATLVVLGAKQYETRDWQTAHRGLLAIHASRSFPEPSAALCQQEPYRSVLLRAGYQSGADLPRGALIGTVTVVEVHATEELDLSRLTAEELAFGDFGPHRFVWQLAEPRLLAKPIKIAGQLRIYEIPDQWIT
jgi:activating signal cointegrator 1